MSDTTQSHYLLYHYTPSSVAAAIFAVLFGITASFQVFKLIKTRTWYFIPFVIGGLCETIGYIGRIISSRQTALNWTLGPYICQSLLILLAPIFFAASIYMILGRIIRLTDGESRAIIRAKWCTKLFVGGDIFSFLMQSTGGGMLASAKKQSSVDLGQKIILIGLCIQLLFFGFFIITIAVFHRRISQRPTTRSSSLTVNWKQYLSVLYIASILIIIRSAFRTVEYGMGQDGVLLRSEVYLYIFDAALMFLLTVMLSWKHPSAVVTRESLKTTNLIEETELGRSHFRNESK